MNRLFLLIASIAIWGLLSCSQTNNTKNEIDAVEKTEWCSSDTLQSYEVYIPSRNSEKQSLPLLVIIDSHGAGKFAINKFKEAAEQYSTVLVASNYVKNGSADFEKAIQIAIEDARKKLPVNQTIFLAGFSGGARMVFIYASVHSAQGIIMCGALADPSQLSSLGMPIISISGTDDFNFIETAQFLYQENNIPKNLKIEFTNQSHSWPNPSILCNSLGLLRIADRARTNADFDESEYSEYNAFQNTRIDSLEKQGDYIRSAMLARTMASTAPFNTDKTFASKYKKLKMSTEYTKELSELRKCLMYEMNSRQSYADAFLLKDSTWWNSEISSIENNIATEKNAFQIDMNKRIKGYLGITSYSLSKLAIRKKDADMLSKILFVYKRLEPQNPDMFYFSAFPDYWAGNEAGAVANLKKAIDLGFADMEQIQANFPESIVTQL